MNVISNQSVTPRWEVKGRTYSPETLDQATLGPGGELGIYRFQQQVAPNRVLGALKGAGVGLLAGVIVGAGSLGWTLAAGLGGGLLGAFLARPRMAEAAITGLLSRGSDGHILFRPNNDATREVDLSTGSPVAPPQSAEGLTLDQIKQLPEFGWTVPTRDQQLGRLKSEEFDVIVIGGGATGAGTALESARRGLKTACLESWDWSSGTSSRSTKLIHGGVRYLEKAVKNLDKEQYELVKEGLHERASFLEMAPHLTDEVKLVTPCFKMWEVPYYFAGLWLYDRIAGHAGLSATRVLTAGAAKEQLPALKNEGLAGAIEYSDGEFNDARMNVGLALTAAAHGAAVANYIEVLGVLKDDAGKVNGVKVRDRRSGEEFEMKGKVVVNATGPFIDGIRKMDDPSAPDLVVPSAGTHIFVPKLKLDKAILVPAAPNGSVAFLKPFEGGTLIGTTEEKTSLTMEPQTTEDQVEYLRNLANQYLDANHQIQPQDITSVWTGIRPLVKDPKKPGNGKTVELCRNHLIDVSASGLVTIGGGKWTSFQRMAEDTINEAIKSAGLPDVPTQRVGARIIGAHGYSEGLAAQLVDRFKLSPDTAEHLARNYGDRAITVAEIAASQGLSGRLAAGHPYIEAEVVYTAKHEMAVNAVDVLSRRTRLSFLDEAATLAALPRTVELMAKTLGWDEATAGRELREAREYFERNGMTGLANKP